MRQAAQLQAGLPAITYRNRYVILGIVLVSSFVSGLNSTMVTIALPTITAHFGADLAQSLWTMTGYLLAMTGLFIFFGKLSELTGRARMFLAGFAVFTLASLGCGFAASLDWLIAFRFIQGIGASMMSGIGSALIFQAFPPEERGKALGMLAVAFAASSLIGPVLGGFIVDRLGWEYIFLLNVPVGVLLLAFGIRYLKVQEISSRGFSMDWIGAGTLFLALASLVLACGELAKSLAFTRSLGLSVLVFSLSSAAFLAWESRCRKPLLDLSIFRDKRFTLPVLGVLLSNLPVSVANTLSPFYFQDVLGFTPSQVGLVSMVIPAFMVLAGPVSGWLYDQYRWKYHTAFTLAVSPIVFAALGYAFVTANLGLAIVAFAFRGICGGTFVGPNSIETMSALSPERTAIASSVATTATYLATMIGVAASTVLLTAGLRLSGYAGMPSQAGPALLANTMGWVLVGVGASFAVGAAACALRNVGRAP